MKTKIKTLKKVYLVFRQNSLGDYHVIRAFAKRLDAKKFCDRKNNIHKPGFDSYGHCEGIYHDFSKIVVE